MVRWLTRALVIVVIVAIALIVLGFAELLVSVESKGTASMAPTIPACDGRVVAQGFTYRVSDPSPGDVVAVHAAETGEGEVVPDVDARDLELLLRVAAGPGDEIVGRNGAVFVNKVKFDDIETEPFPLVRVPNEQYFVLGDNRSASVDSRDFGTIRGDAIFAKVFFVYWPLGDLGFLPDRISAEPALGEEALVAPPGPVDCG